MDIYDIVLIGNYTKDTIISVSGTRFTDGGGIYYGASAVVAMGLKVAVVTRLAKADIHAVHNLKRIGVVVFPEFTPQSTQMQLEYPANDPHNRILSTTSTAGSFTSDQIKDLQARIFLITPCVRGEVPLKVINELRQKDVLLAGDVQGFIRVVGSDKRVAHEAWPEKEDILAQLDILKVDDQEAEFLTGKRNMSESAEILAGFGPDEIVLTHSKGVLVYAAGKIFEAPYTPRSLEGRTGRGDTCISAYLASRLKSLPADSCKFAAAATSLKLEKEGPFNGTYQDILDKLTTDYLDEKETV